MMLEDTLLWCVYVAALHAQKQRKNAHLTFKPKWQRDLVRVREHLEDRGLRL